MIEKRFTIADYPTDIVDNQTGEKYACSSYSTHMEIICDLLNTLADENEQLKKIIEDNVDFKIIFSDRDLNDICNEMGYELSENEIKLQRLEKENEKLKQKNKGLQSELHIFKEDVTHSNKIIDKLNDENEQLKSEIENNIKNYKQSNRRVFDLIDKKIKEVDTIGAEVLKDLRRELIE